VVVVGEGLPDIGGSGANQADLAVRLAGRGHPVAFASRWPVPADGSRIQALRAAGVDLLVPDPRIFKAMALGARAASLGSLPRSHRVRAVLLDQHLKLAVRRWARGRRDVVVHVIGRETAQPLPALKQLGFPIVFSELGQLLNLGISEAEVRARPLRVAAYTADSSKAARLLSDVEGAPVPFVPSVGGFSDEPGPPRDVARHFGTISRLDPVKRVHVAVAAFAVFEAGRLTIYGDGSESGVVRRAIEECGVGDRVTLAGAVRPDTIAAALDDLDALLLPSADSEGTPVAVLEAMSRGRAVIATPVGGLVDILDDGVSGLFFDGSAEDLAAKLAAVTEPGVARKLGEAARAAWVERLSPDRVLDQFEAIYASLSQPSG
jgi:glycosyltransferase involved in cell wall biosynthesis